MISITKLFAKEGKTMEHTIKRYIAAVGRRLELPRDVKKRCLSDLRATITSRLAGGESWEQVREALGSPGEAAARIREQTAEFAYHKSKWRFAFLALAVLSGGWLAFYGGMMLILTLSLRAAAPAQSVGIIGGADGPTAVFVTTSAGPDWDLILMAGALLVGIVGYWHLRRLGGGKTS